MKKTTNHITYNTNTATILAHQDRNLPAGDYNFYSASVMRTPKGRHFLYVIGSMGEEAIHPCTDAQARDLIRLVEAKEFGHASYLDWWAARN